MKRSILILSLLFYSFCYSQKENIQLPKGDFKIRYSKHNITPIRSIYITKKGVVYLDNTKILIKNLGETLYKQKLLLPPINQTDVLVHILADVNAPYKTVDAVKSQIASAYFFKVFYRVNNLVDITNALGLRGQGTLSYQKRVKASQVKNENDQIVTFKIGKHPIEELMDELYSLNFDKVSNLLNKYRFKKVKFLKGEKIKIGRKKIKLDNHESIFNELKELDFYFIIPTKNLKYGDYFKSISTIIKIYRSKKRDIPFIEISKELQKSLKENKFSL